MVKLRLARMGSKKRPFYRIVAADERAPRDGRFLDIVGHYDPRTEPHTLKVDMEKVEKWLSRGAKATDRVRRLLATLASQEAGS